MRCVSCGLIDVHHHIIPPFYLEENHHGFQLKAAPLGIE